MVARAGKTGHGSARQGLADRAGLLGAWALSRDVGRLLGEAVVQALSLGLGVIYPKSLAVVKHMAEVWPNAPACRAQLSRRTSVQPSPAASLERYLPKLRLCIKHDCPPPRLWEPPYNSASMKRNSLGTSCK